MTPTALLEMRRIAKSFGPVRALSGVDLSVRAASIHALVGENGAGKSTLMKVLSGVYPAGSYEGDIVFDGAVQQFQSLRDSEREGIVIIHQELALVPQLSIAENLFLGHEPARWGVVDRAARHRRAVAMLERVGLRVSPDTPVGDLGVGQQQLVEIAKALAKDVRVLILDEPTASLGEVDSQTLLALLQQLKAQGVACILISHKLPEIRQVADEVTVLRDGATVDHFDCRDAPTSADRMVSSMVGRELLNHYPQRERLAPGTGEVVLAVQGWTVQDPLHPQREAISDVSFEVRRGEILGIAGLMGAGRTELAMSLFGRAWGRDVRGRAMLRGQDVDLSSIPRAIDAGLAYVTEDRKALGLVLAQSIARNTTMANLSGVARHGVVNDGREQLVAEGYRAQLRTRCHGVDQPVGQLSGGNQQKVMLSRWLFTDPAVLIVDEPTRGIDVGAKFEIYSLLADMAAQGKAIVMISSDLPELLGLCDRILAMHDGRLVGEFDAATATQEAVMASIVKH